MTVNGKGLAIVGIFLAGLGLFLAIAFWPLTTVSGAELLAAREGNEYPIYPAGSRITIHETVLEVVSTQFLGSEFTSLELEDANPDATTTILVRGDASGVVRPGDVIYVSVVLQQVTFFGTPLQYWEASTPQDIRPSWPVDALFYATMAAGVGILAFAALRKR